MDTLNLSNEHVKKQFSTFLMFWVLNQGLTIQSFSSKCGLSTKQLKRYLPGPQRDLPSSIPLNTFHILLKTIGKTYEDFQSYYNSSLVQPAECDNRRVLNNRIVLLERLSPDDDLEPPIDDTDQSKGGASSILWVDDSPSNNSSIITWLKGSGVLVKMVTSTKDAIDIFRAGRYDQIISDMKRPDSNRAGMELTCAIRAINKVVPIHIFCGDWSAQYLKQQAFDAGVTSITSTEVNLLASLKLST